MHLGRSSRRTAWGLTAVASVVLAGLSPLAGAAAQQPSSAEDSHLTRYVEGRDYTVQETADGRELTIPADLGDAELPPVAPSAKAPTAQSPGLTDSGKALALLGAPDDSTTTIRPRSAQRAEPERRTARVVANGAWSFYMTPRVLQTGKATYFGTVTNGGTVRVTRLALAHNRMDHAVLGKVPTADDHDSPTITRTPDGRIAAFWSGHGNLPVRYRVSRTPESVNTFGPVRRLEGSGLENADSTYTVITQMAGEKNRYWVFTRVKNHRGIRQSWWLSTSKDLVRWTRAVQITRNPYPKSVTKGWPYLRMISDGNRTIDIAVTDGDPTNLMVNSQYHIRYTNGKFVRSDGSLIRTMWDLQGGADGPEPLDPREGTLIFNGSGPEGRARVYDIARGPGGQLVVAMTTYSLKERALKWFRLDKGQWVASTIQRGKGGGKSFAYGYDLVYGAPNRAYLVSIDPSVSEQYDNEVQEWWTDDAGGSWSYRTVARGGGRDYRNPVAPWGVKPPQYGPAATPNSVFWMVGKYDHWTRFSTRIEMETTYDRPVWVSAKLNTVKGNHRRVAVTVQQGVGGPAVPGAPVKLAVSYPRKGVVARYAGVTSKVLGKADAKGKFGSAAIYLPKGAKVTATVPSSGGWGWGQAFPMTVR